VNESLWTFVFEIANFVALAALLAWLFFKPVRQALEDQQAKRKRLEDEAAQKLAEADRLQREVDSQRQGLSRELDEMRSKAREAANAEKNRIIVEGRAQIERERGALKRESLNIDSTQTARISRAVATATGQTVRQFLQQIEGPELEQALVKAACRELQAFSNNSLAPVVVECAASLDEMSRQLIRDAIGVSADSAEFRIVPELVGGLRISTSRGLIDASIRGIATFAKNALSAEVESMIRKDSDGE
jgi:F0F1-type ATP synthase membrane subunit b/b'